MRLRSLLRLLVGPVVMASLTSLAVVVLYQFADPSAGDNFLYGGPGGSGAQNQARAGAGDVKSKPKQDFAIADVASRDTNLYPGATQSRWVRVTNPNNFDIVVTSLTAVAGTPLYPNNEPATGCAASNLRIEPLSRPITVARAGTADVALSVRMSADAPNACQNVRFPLTYTGIASKP